MDQIRQRGFSFVEMMLAAAILATLATVSLPMVQLESKRVREKELRAALVTIRKGLDQYRDLVLRGDIINKSTKSGYPLRLDDLLIAEGRSGEPVRVLRNVPTDPFLRNAFQGVEPWGIKPFHPAGKNPATGEVEIYDVFSQSAELGLNKIPYREW